MEYYRPIDIARELHISTSALRHYEAWGVVPSPERAGNGYRLYTRVHLEYFRCLRALIPAYGVPVACKAMVHIQNGEMDSAFWLINKEQAELHHEKTIADQTLALLQNPDLPPAGNKKQKAYMSIGEVSAYTAVQSSAIRHWEKEGLITLTVIPKMATGSLQRCISGKFCSSACCGERFIFWIICGKSFRR